VRKSILFVVVYIIVFYICECFADDISITIQDQKIFSGSTVYVGSSMHVVVTVNSLYEIKHAYAQVGDLQEAMSYSECAFSSRSGCMSGFVADLSLAGMERGEKTLVVRVTDVFGNSAEARRTIVYDDKPVVTVAEPLDDTVAHPMLRILASCTDDDPGGCASLDVVANDPSHPIASGTSLIDESVSLADLAPVTSLTVTITGTDSAGQKTVVRRRVLVIHGGNLREIVTVPGMVWDYGADGRVLFIEHHDGGDALKWMDASGVEHVVPSGGGKKISKGRLTPHGAMFYMYDQDQPSYRGRFYDYRDGALIQLQRGYDGSFEVAGRYAVWGGNRDTDIYLRDLESGETFVAGGHDALDPSWPDLASNGDVVFMTPHEFDTNIFRYRNGTLTRITDDRGAASGVPSWYRNYFPRTDGINVAYTKKLVGNPPKSGPVAIYLYDGSREILLSTLDEDAGQYDTPPFPQYLLNGGWTAYPRYSDSGVSQVWLRSPSGRETQASFFGSDSRIDALAPNGQVTFLNRGKLYLGSPGKIPVQMPTSLGRRLYLNGAWHFLVGRSVLVFDPDAPASGSMEVRPDSRDFGRIPVGQQSAVQEFVLVNVGSGYLAISDISLSNTTDFQLDLNAGSRPCGTASPHLTEGESCTFGVLFVPASGGAKVAMVTIRTTDLAILDEDISLQGVGALPNTPPTADAGPDTIATVPLVLDASGSSDTDGSIVVYRWEITAREDGTVRRATGISPVLTGLPAGFYDVVLTVQDDAGATATDTMLLAVAGADGGSTARCADLLAAKDAEIARFDVRADGVIGLPEAIRALRVAAGKER